MPAVVCHRIDKILLAAVCFHGFGVDLAAYVHGIHAVGGETGKDVLGIAELVAALRPVKGADIGAGGLIANAAAFVDAGSAAVGELHQRIAVGVDVIPLVHALFINPVARGLGIAEGHNARSTGAQRVQHHGRGMRGVIERRHAGIDQILTKVLGKVGNIVMILGLGIDKGAEVALFVALLAVHGAGIIDAGFAHHIGFAGFLYGFDNLPAFLHGHTHGHRGIHILSGLQRRLDQRSVQMSLGEDGHGRNFGVGYRVFKGVDDLDPEPLGILPGALRDDIAHIYFFNIWMCLKQRYKVAGKVAAADNCNRDFFCHTIQLPSEMYLHYTGVRPRQQR